MNNEQFTKRTNTIISNKQLQTLNSVQALRASLRFQHCIPDVISIYNAGGTDLLESVNIKLLLIQGNREAIATTSKQINVILSSLLDSLQKGGIK